MGLENLTDNELVLRSRNGSPEQAYTVLYNRHQKSINNILIGYIPNNEDRKDMTQEVLTKIFLNLKNYDTSQQFNGWVYTITKNAASSYIKKQNTKGRDLIDKSKEIMATESFLEQKTYPSQEEVIHNKNIYKIIERIIEKLPECSRETIKLKFRKEYSHKELGQILNKKEGTIKTNYYRGLKALEEMIPEAFGQDFVVSNIYK